MKTLTAALALSATLAIGATAFADHCGGAGYRSYDALYGSHGGYRTHVGYRSQHIDYRHFDHRYDHHFNRVTHTFPIERVQSCQYHVYYLDHCDAWRCCAKYTHQYNAERSAHLLSRRGYHVRIREVHLR